MERFEVLWARAVHPARAFGERALEAPPLGEAWRGLLLLRAPLAFLGLLLTYANFQTLYAKLADPAGEFWTFIVQRAPEAVDPAELTAALGHLPGLPSLIRMLPWLALAAPLLVLSLWLHDATLDHLSLWLLRGLKTRRSFRITLVADAEALKVGALGAALGLLAELPGTGLAVTLLLVPVGIYFWILRGYALAAWHGCPLWKGLAATILNMVLAVVLVGLMVLACVIMVILLL